MNINRGPESGRPIPNLSINDLKRFWSNVNKDGPIQKHCPELGKCWTWTGAVKSDSGYGRFRIGELKFRPHRVSFFIHYGQTKRASLIAHKCDNRSCVNPEHIIEATVAWNSDDKMIKGRDDCARGERSHFHVVTAEQVREIRSKYIPNVYGFARLGKEYGISHGTVEFIVKKKTWKHIE